jgi:hypothetical protein
MEAAARLATLVLPRAACVGSESDGLRISLNGGSTAGAGIWMESSLESVFERTELRSADGDSRVASDVCAKLKVPQMPSGATTP